MKVTKNAIVTGAGRHKGIGAEVCRSLAKNGYNVFFTSFDEYDYQIANITKNDYIMTMNECLNYGVKVFYESYDLRYYDNIKQLFKEANNKLGTIDVLVNCACYHVFDKLETISEQLIDTNLEVNSKTTLLLCKEFYLNYRGQSGRIINLSSTQNLESLTSEISYAISKASVPIITTTLYPIMAEKGITINAVNPGATDVDDINDNNIELYKKNNSFGRLGTPKDAANIICFLISDKGKWITGQTINSEGALWRGLPKK